MDTSSVTTNTLDNSCFGTFQVSSDGFTSCVQMSSSPSSSNSDDKTFTITPKDYLSYSTVFRIRITTGTKDSSGNSLTSQWNTSSGFQTVADTTPPTLTQITAITTPTNDNTPNYTFSTNEAGTITYGGSCSSGTTSAISGNNTITLISLSDGTYSNCTITVTDSVGNVSNSLTVTSFIVDSTAATLLEVTAVTTSTNDTSPDYTFSSSEAGTITYGGSCSSSTTSATTDNNTITLVSLSDGTYSDCTITVTDTASNSVTLNISSFVIDTTAPTVSSTYPTDNQSGTSVSGNISVTFSEAMDNTSTTTNTSNTSCSGSIQLSLDNFSSCLQISSSPSISNSNKTLTLEPYDNFSLSTTYKIRVTNGVKDIAGNYLSSQWSQTNGFQTTSWNGTQSLGGSGYDEGLAMKKDSSGNIYITGHSSEDLFLVKYNSSGIKQWTKHLGTSSLDRGSDLTIDSSNNLYVTGYTNGGLDGNSSSGGSDFFLAKYYDNGTKQWTKQLGTSGSDVGNRVTIDNSSNIYITGSTTGGLDGNTHSGGWDIFLVKYNSSGDKQWTKQLGTTSGSDYGNGVTVDYSNNIYVTGTAEDGLDGNSAAGSDDIILIKYFDNGTKQWTKQIGTSGSDGGFGVTVDNSSNIYITGYTNGVLDGSTYSGSADMFLLKYNSDGVLQ